MDRRYYYRILGLREGASTAEIEKAYNRQMRRLDLPDYADDPEYVARKKDQIRHAYRVLTGSARPATKSQKDARFQRRKDAEDAGEDGIAGLKRAFEKHTKRCESDAELPAGLQDLKNMLEGVLGGAAFENRSRKTDENRNAKLAKIIVVCVIGLSLFSSVVTACGALIMNIADEFSFEQATPEYSVQIEPDEVTAETGKRIDQILACSGMYDYYGNLDMAAQDIFMEKVDWDVMGDAYEDIWGHTMDISYSLGLNSISDAVYYITGSEDAYWENDDYSNAEILIGIMAPPAFEEIAGSVSLYNGEPILNYADYLVFIRDVTEFQTKALLG